MPRGVPGGTVRRDAIGDAIYNCEFELVQDAHVAMQEDTVTIIDQCED